MTSPEPEDLTSTANVIVNTSRSSTPGVVIKEDTNKKETCITPRFQIPQDVLKNLTPLGNFSTTTKSHHAMKRRQEHLNSIKHKLKQRSMELSKRVQVVQSKRQEELDRRITQLNRDLHEKKQRRSKYLDLIRDRASRFYYRNVSLKPEKLVTKQYRTEKILEEKNGDDLFVEIQRCCRKVLFHKYVSILQECKFLDNFENYSFNKIIEVLNTENNVKRGILFILKYLNVPQLFGFDYKPFFYCFIMISDFNDCMKNDKSPGFNANNSKYESELYFHNSIWLLVYKFTKLLIHEFRLVVGNKLLTEKFLNIWNNYNFIYKIFKWNHYRNICDILSDALQIVSQQVEVIENAHLIQQKQRLIQEWTLLKHYNVAELKQFNESEQVEEFKKSIRNIISELYSSNMTTHTVFIQNGIRVIRFDSYKFYLPSCAILSVKDWRKYWFNKFINQEVREFPKKLRSGNIKNLIEIDTNEFIQVEDVVTVQVPEKCLKKYERLPQIYHDLREYYLEFSSLDDIEDDETNYLKLIEKLLLYYDSQNKYLIELLEKINHEDSSAIYELEVYVCNLWINKSKFINFTRFLQFENIFTLINSQNFNKLKFNIFTSSSHLIFDNFYKLILKYNQPNLELTREYQRKILHAGFKNSISRVLIDLDMPSARNFFMDLFFRIIVYEEMYQLDELNELYFEKFIELHKQISQLIDSTVFILLYSNYIYPEDVQRPVLTKTKIYTLVSRLNKDRGEVRHILQEENIQDFGFYNYYFDSREVIKELLQGKFIKILQHLKESSELYSMIEGNFKDFNHEILQLVNEVRKSSLFIYKLYNPILNWIYLDLGY